MGPPSNADRRADPAGALVGACRTPGQRRVARGRPARDYGRAPAHADVPGRAVVPSGARLAHVRQAGGTVALSVLPGAVRGLHRALAAELHREIRRFRTELDLAAVFYRQL